MQRRWKDGGSDDRTGVTAAAGVSGWSVQLPITIRSHITPQLNTHSPTASQRSPLSDCATANRASLAVFMSQQFLSAACPVSVR